MRLDHKKTKNIIAAMLLLLGVAAGIGYRIDDGRWAILLSKGGYEVQYGPPSVLLGGLISMLTMCGQALAYHTTGNLASPLPFWIGQFAFYGFLFVAIPRVRSRKKQNDGG